VLIAKVEILQRFHALHELFLKLVNHPSKSLLKMHHHGNCQSDHGEAFFFEYKLKQFGDILDGEVVDEEANKPLEDPHLVRYAYPLDL
jgi:hypothetical protein